MNAEGNKELIRRLVDEILNKRNTDAVDEIFTEDYTPHDLSFNPLPRSGAYSHDRMKQAMSRPNSFPDGHVTIDAMTAEGDRVSCLWTVHGTHAGEMQTVRFGNIAPTGKPVTWKGITIYRIEEDKIAEAWTLADNLGMFEQLGVLPSRG
jgi:predicted ester cyclase